jgi:hypothetical protein
VVVQVVAHAPALQWATPPVTVVEHLFAQAPQLLSSVCSLTQAVPQMF